MTASPRPATPALVPGLLRLLRQRSAEIEVVVSGSSMGAAIPDHAGVRVRLDAGDGAKEQDVVAVLLGGETLSIHRLIHRGTSRRAQGFLITHGDGNVFCDAPQRTGDVVGTVTGIRQPGTEPWSVVAPAGRPSGPRRVITWMFERLMCAALELSPGLAFGVKNLLVIVLTPLMRLRYGAADHRSTSRLVRGTPVTAP